MLRAARVGVQVPGDVTFKEREMGVVGGGFDGGGISTAVVDVFWWRAQRPFNRD